MAATQTLDRLATALAELKRLDTADGRGVDLNHLRALLYIHAKPGRTQTEVAAATDVSQPTMVRVVARLSERERRNQPGLGLIVAEVGADDRKRRELFLTPAGHRLVQKLEAILQGTNNHRREATHAREEA
jgi:DNA-binding MarR family transcriptional regulator